MRIMSNVIVIVNYLFYTNPVLSCHSPVLSSTKRLFGIQGNELIHVSVSNLHTKTDIIHKSTHMHPVQCRSYRRAFFYLMFHPIDEFGVQNFLLYGRGQFLERRNAPNHVRDGFAVGFFALAPKTHWSTSKSEKEGKDTNPKTSGRAQIEEASGLHTGCAGCSRIDGTPAFHAVAAKSKAVLSNAFATSTLWRSFLLRV